MNKLIALIFSVISISAFSQEIDLNKEADKLLNQAILYSKIIRANEITLTQIDNANDFVYSYFIDNKIKSIVFSKKPDNKQILQTIIYSDSLSILNCDSVPRDKTVEEDLFVNIYYNMYASSMYFPLPQYYWAIIEKKTDKFYAFMFPQQTDLKNIIFGHDYLFTYRLDGEFKDFKFIHNNQIPMPFEKPSDSEVTLHTHANRNSEFISALDIASIIVCKDKLKWKKHFVVSKKYVSIFDLDSLTLTIELKKDYESKTGTKLKI